METRDILNYLGVKIGELTLPSNTSEDDWTKALAPYAVAPKTLSELKSEKCLQFEKDTREYIFERFPIEKQMSLLLLWTEAALTSKPNRMAYIQQAIDWVNALLGWHFAKYHELEDATDEASLSAVNIEFFNLVEAPNVSIEEALGILD